MTSFIEVPSGAPWRMFRRGKCRAFVARERERWRLSISRADGRYPTWDEIADARYQLLPHDLVFVMILPPPEHYVNVSNVFHLWETQDANLPDVGSSAAMVRTHEDGTPA